MSSTVVMNTRPESYCCRKRRTDRKPEINHLSQTHDRNTAEERKIDEEVKGKVLKRLTRRKARLVLHTGNMKPVFFPHWFICGGSSLVVIPLLLHVAFSEKKKTIYSADFNPRKTQRWAANTNPVLIINCLSIQCQSVNCAATCTKAKKKGAQNSADSNHKNQNYPNCFDLEIKEKITSFFNK